MAYILKRLGYYLLAFWASVTLNFLLPRLMPGDPVSRMFARSGARLTQTQALQLRRLFGLDDSATSSPSSPGTWAYPSPASRRRSARSSAARSAGPSCWAASPW